MKKNRDRFVNGELWPDDHGVHINAHGGGILRHGGRWYWFGEHKIAGSEGNKAHVGVHVYSSDTLYSWRDEGIALAVSDDPASDIADGCILERPKVIHHLESGTFVMWFHLELIGQGYDAARVGVATSRNVTGPYEFIGSGRLDPGVWPRNATDDDRLPGPENLLARDLETGQMSRDMTLFVDADGTAWHLGSSEDNRTTHLTRLSDDYLRSSSDYWRLFPGRFMEAHAVWRHDNRYFYIASGCTGWAPNSARGAVAEHLTGPWFEFGNPCRGPEEELTFGAQSTFAFPVEGRPGAFIVMFDLWRPENAIDGRYLWLPVTFLEDGTYEIRYRKEWDLTVFDG